MTTLRSELSGQAFDLSSNAVKTIMVAAAVLFMAAPASAHFPSKCASELNFFSVDGMTTQKWKSENVSTSTKELLAKSDPVRLRNWAAHVDANQQYLAQTMLPAIKELLKCIAASEESAKAK